MALACLNSGSGDDHRHAQTPIGGVEFVQRPWRRNRCGPFRAYEAEAAALAHVFEVPAIAIEAHPDIHPGLMNRIAGLRPVVRCDNKDRSIQFATRCDVIHQAPDMMVHGLDHAGIDFHRACVLGPLVGPKREPRARVGR